VQFIVPHNYCATNPQQIMLYPEPKALVKRETGVRAENGC